MFARAAVRPGPGLFWRRGCCSPLAILIAAKPKRDPAVQVMKSVQEELSASFWHVSGGYPRVLPARSVPQALLVHLAKGSVWPVNQSVKQKLMYSVYPDVISAESSSKLIQQHPRC